MLKWVEIAVKNNRARYEELSRFLNENQFPNQVEFIEVSVEDFPKAFEEARSKYEAVRIGHGLGEKVFPLLPHKGATVETVRIADTAARVNDVWWLSLYVIDGFSHVLRRSGELFDLDSDVLIVGAGAAARVAIHSLFVAGFKKFAISSQNEQQVESLILNLQRNYFGAQFRSVPKDGLVLLPGVHGVMVNTTPLLENNPMLEELYYFNFFKSGGLAVDFTISPIETPLLKGAKDVGAHCIFGYQISAHTDIRWVEQMTGRAFNADAYEDRLKQGLSPKS